MVWFSHHNHYRSSEKGQFLLELLIAMAMLGLLLPVLVGGLVIGREGVPQQKKRESARLLLDSTTDSIRVVRENNWQSIATLSGTFHPSSRGNSWVLVSGSDTQNGLTRQVIFEPVNRNSSGTIVTTGGSLDPSTKKVTTRISWTLPDSGEIEATHYLTRYLDNVSFTHTTAADFTGISPNLGLLSNTAVTTTNGGEVALSLSSFADWCKPQNFVVNQIALPKLSNAIYSKQGGAYLGSGDGASNSPAFINVGITEPAPPGTPSATVLGSFNGQFTTNSIYSDGRYVYLATTASPQIKILDLDTSPYTQVGTVTIPGGAPANSVYLSSNNNILFTTSGNTLYSFDVTNKSGSHTTVKSSITMRASIWSQPTARQVFVVGNRAYVGTGNSLLGLQTFSFNSSGGNLTFVAAALLTFSQESQGLFVDANAHYAYIAFNNANGISFTKGMVVIDLTKTSWFLITYYPRSYTYNTGGMDPRGITVPTNTRAIVVGVGGGSTAGTEQYQVIDTSSLNSQNPSLTYCGGYRVASGVFGISSILDQYSTAYSYIITGEAGNQFKIIRGGEGGGGYALSGTYQSPIFDAGYATAFNYISGHFTLPNGNTAGKFQVSGADPVNGSCLNSTFTFVGPDLTGNSYISSASDIPLNDDGVGYENPAQCFRFKVFLETSDPQSTPLFEDILVNYSP